LNQRQPGSFYTSFGHFLFKNGSIREQSGNKYRHGTKVQKHVEAHPMEAGFLMVNGGGR
jgi:hypothetical protein